MRPIEDLIGESMLQVAEARGNRGVLKLRHVDHHFRTGLARGHCEDRSRFEQTIINRISEVSPLDTLQSLADQNGIQ